MPGKVHQEQPRAVDRLRGTTGPRGAARHRPSASEHQGMVAAQQQVRRPISQVLAGGAEVQATGHRPRGRVDDLQNTVGDGDDPAAISLDQVRLVHPGHIVVRAGIRRCRGRVRPRLQRRPPARPAPAAAATGYGMPFADEASPGRP